MDNVRPQVDSVRVEANATSQQRAPASVVIVEDDEPTRRYLCAAVRAASTLQLLGDAGTLAGGRALLEAHNVDVLLTDLGLPDGSGLSLITETRRKTPETRIMVVTVFGDEKTVISAIEAGAGGYLLKDGTAEQMAASIDELLQGGAPLSPAVARFLLKRLRKKDPPIVSPDAPALTGREREILKLVAKGFSFKEVADLLDCSVHTVKTHVRHIYRKLEVGSRGEAVYEAISLGLIEPR